MTHGHELRGRGMQVGREAKDRGEKRREKWDTCNSIVNKIYLKEKMNLPLCKKLKK